MGKAIIFKCKTENKRGIVATVAFDTGGCYEVIRRSLKHRGDYVEVVRRDMDAEEVEECRHDTRIRFAPYISLEALVKDEYTITNDATFCTLLIKALKLTSSLETILQSSTQQTLV